jgi:hypothetical protein
MLVQKRMAPMQIVLQKTVQKWERRESDEALREIVIQKNTSKLLR